MPHFFHTLSTLLPHFLYLCIGKKKALFMAKPLYNTPDELLAGYSDTNRPFRLDNCLSKGKGGRRVYLIGRVLNSGNISLMRYSCKNGKRVRETLNVVLHLETDLNVKRENEEKVRYHVLETNRINEELERSEAGYIPKSKSKVKLCAFVLKQGDDAAKESGNKRSTFAHMVSLAAHLEICFGKDVTLGDVDEALVRKFVEYLKREALNMNYLRAKDVKRKRKVRLSQNTQNRLIRNLNWALNKARKQKLIFTNPMTLLDADDKVPTKAGEREFLTDDEVEKLMNTPCRSEYNIKEAFLFSCMTGLRWSDLRRLKMSDFRIDKKFGRYLKIRMVKTKEPLKIYVPDAAFALLPEVDDDEKPIFRLHAQNDHANVHLRRWMKDAGINKYISFHCARHTSATMLLSMGLPLSVVQKQLGHLKASTTEIYAKLMDEAQAEASVKMNERFGRTRG